MQKIYTEKKRKGEEDFFPKKSIRKSQLKMNFERNEDDTESYWNENESKARKNFFDEESDTVVMILYDFNSSLSSFNFFIAFL